MTYHSTKDLNNELEKPIISLDNTLPSTHDSLESGNMQSDF